MQKEQKKDKLVYLEIIRIVSCLFVILNHSCTLYMLGVAPLDATRILLDVLFLLCKTAVPMFLMVSGALLLGREEPLQKVLKRVGRILLIIILMSAIYYVLGREELSLGGFFLGLFAGPMTNSYWYLYLYFGMLLMLPILRKLQLAEKEYLYLTVLYVIFQGLFPVMSYYFGWQRMAEEIHFPLFSTYVYCFLMGYYFVKVKKTYTKKGALISALAVTLSLGISLGLTLWENGQKGFAMFDVLYEKEIYLPTMALALGLFYLIGYMGNFHFPRLLKSILVYVGGCTFTIYLVSDIFIHHVPEMVWNGNMLAGVLLKTAGVFMAGLLVASVLRFVPGIRKILFS